MNENEAEQDIGEFFATEALRNIYQEFTRAYPGRILSGCCQNEAESRRLSLDIDLSGGRSRRVWLTALDGEERLNAMTDAGTVPSDTILRLTLTLMGYSRHPIYTPALAAGARLMLGCSVRTRLLDQQELHKLTVGLAEAAQRLEDAFLCNSVYPESWCLGPETPGCVSYRVGG